ncbi:hypothetical protein DSL92_00285 [Billgrantia gudaonensis]|uniref:Uncharacterized protein n=1 Tax=Billgrantia gudaonensis TaxID=376427 RepID=A0A432JLW2_9GAMM|nr:hypothetical protein DSL92_00285 [Halomonas gudaonensis]
MRPAPASRHLSPAGWPAARGTWPAAARLAGRTRGRCRRGHDELAARWPAIRPPDRPSPRTWRARISAIWSG